MGGGAILGRRINLILMTCSKLTRRPGVAASQQTNCCHRRTGAGSSSEQGKIVDKSDSLILLILTAVRGAAGTYEVLLL
jgi:hypothetical protein